MKASELRIGNYVTTINIGCEVHLPTMITEMIGRVHFFNVELYDYKKPFAVQEFGRKEDISNLSPIPLTEEWLLKFGFKITIDEEYKARYDSPNPKMTHIDFQLNRKGLYLTGLRYEENVIGTPKYVHQLQNLYFALTNEELTLNKTK